MRYQGGKYYQAKNIIPYIHTCMKENKINKYIEPFVGGANVMFRVNAKERYGNDIDNELIEYYKWVTAGGESYESVSEELFYDMRDNPENYQPYQLGNVKYMASFGGKGFNSGYARPGKRTQYQGAINNFKKQIPKLLDVIWSSVDYKEFLYPNEKSFIYCDPPYKGTAGYNNKEFNSDEFYDWFKEISKKHYCILSEYNAPEDFTLLKEIPTRVRIDGKNTKSVVDKLFYCDGLFKNWYENKEG